MMDQGDLFDRGEDSAMQPKAELPRIGSKRLRHAVRNQVEFQECSLDELLPEEHEARIVWDYVCGLDLSELQQQVKAVALWYALAHNLMRAVALRVAAAQRRRVAVDDDETSKPHKLGSLWA